MSTTTNFKRIALVAVAALGLGVLSSVPSQAAINADTLTLSATTAAQSTNETYTATSAVVTVSFFGATGDSMSITAALTAAPAGNTALPTLQLLETSSAFVETNTTAGRKQIVGDTTTANTAVSTKALSGAVVTTAKFAVYLTQGNGGAAPSTVGAYGVKITPATIGVSGALQGSAAVNLTITVSAAAALDKKAAAATSKVFIQNTSAAGYVPTTDSAVVVAKTAATASAAFLYILPSNAAGTTSASESLTVTTTLGNLQTTRGTPLGRSLNVIGDGTTPTYVYISPDGNAGTGSITVTSAAGVLLSTKSVTFSGTATKFGTAAIPATSATVIGATGTTIVSVAAQDASSNTAPDATVYAFSSDTTKLTVPATAVSWATATSNYPVTVTGVAAGTATITFGDATTLAASTFKSNPVTVRVGSATPANVKVTLDKTTYNPGEAATLTVTVVDATDLPVVGGTQTDIFAAGGIAANATLGSISDTTTAVTFVTSALTTTKTYTVYMPSNGGPVKFSWTGGTGLAAANRVAGSLTVNVTDSGAAALAAVTALATTVASLRTLIVTLTNLVLKIQKKVRA
jgi:hypothetical protein